MTVGLGHVLRGLRDSKGLSQQDVERNTGLAQSYISKLETGKIQLPAPDVLWTLADAYGTTEIELFEKAGYIRPEVANPGGSELDDPVLRALVRRLAHGTERERQYAIRQLSLLVEAIEHGRGDAG